MTYHFKKALTIDLIDEIEKKRVLSIKEFASSDLYEGESIDKVNKWYLQLKDAILRNPPVSRISGIVIIESDNNVIDIIYEYNTQKSSKKEVSFRVQVVNDDEKGVV